MMALTTPKERRIHARFLTRSGWQVLNALRPTRRVVAALGVLLAACGGTQSTITTDNRGPPGPSGPSVVQITITPTTCTVYFGERCQFTADVTGRSDPPGDVNSLDA